MGDEKKALNKLLNARLPPDFVFIVRNISEHHSTSCCEVLEQIEYLLVPSCHLHPVDTHWTLLPMHQAAQDRPHGTLCLHLWLYFSAFCFPLLCE